MNAASPSDHYRIIIERYGKTYLSVPLDRPLASGEVEADARPATLRECRARIDELWEWRKNFSTGREYTCSADGCSCTSYRPGYCCRECGSRARRTAALEANDDAEGRSPFSEQVNCHCGHPGCHATEGLPKTDPQEALDKMAAAPPEPPRPFPPSVPPPDTLGSLAKEIFSGFFSSKKKESEPGAAEGWISE